MSLLCANKQSKSNNATYLVNEALCFFQNIIIYISAIFIAWYSGLNTN